MVRGIVIGHGDFARAMVETAEQIVGKQTGVEIVSNKGCSCDTLSDNIATIIKRDETRETIVFLDLPGGSCTISCYNLLKHNRDLTIICGMNLPMLIEFFILREKHSVEELVPILLQKGKDNIFKLEGKP